MINLRLIFEQNHYRHPIQGLSVEQGIPQLPNSQNRNAGGFKQEDGTLKYLFHVYESVNYSIEVMNKKLNN